MRYIKVPNSVKMLSIDGTSIKNSNEEWFVDFSEFLLGRLTDKSFSGNVDRLFAVVDMRDEIRNLGDKKYLSLESTHWEYLKDAVKTPHAETGYNHIIAHNLVPFIKAVLSASDKKPEDLNELELEA